MVACTPDSNIATQIPTPTMRYGSPRRTPAARSAMTTPKSPTAMSSAVTERSSLYARAMISRAPTSSTITSVSRKMRVRKDAPPPTMARIPSANAVSVALGILAIVGGGASLRTRIFLLTLVIVDDVGALLIIALAYSEDLSVTALLIAVGLFGVVIALRAAGVRRGLPYLIVGVGIWVAMFESGVHATITGVALGLVATAYPPSREELEEASSRWQLFREQPTSEYARSAVRGVTEAISPNERLQNLFHPVTSFVIVPLFASANRGTITKLVTG